MTLLVYDVILLFSVKSEYSIMSSKKVTVRPNIGCDMTFSYRMAKLHHLRKRCNGAPPEQMIVKVDEHWECKFCRTHIKHQNNISRHKKICNPNKTPKYHECIHCKKVFLHLSKLNRHLKIHTDKGGTCDTCGKVYQYEKHLVQHKITCTDAYPSMSGETTSTYINDENNSSNFYDIDSPNETLILQSEVNPEEQVDSAEVLTKPVSFSSVLHTPTRKKQWKMEKGKSGMKKGF